MITERDSKSHGVRYLVRVDYNGRKCTVGTFRTERDAKRAEREARNQIDRGTFEPKVRGRVKPEPEAPPIPTLADVLAVWLESKRTTLRPNTVTIYESAIRLHINPAMGERDIRRLAHDDVQRQVNAWRDSGMGARLIGRCVVLVQAALDRQVRNGVIPHNPARGVQKPSQRREKEMTIWTGEEIDRFLTEALKDDRLAPLWALTLLEGMRRGEALGLRWRDLHWNRDETECVAVITQTVVSDLANGGGALVQERTKTQASRRTVQLGDDTIAVLKDHRDRQRFERQRLADIWPENDLIVTSGVGTPIIPANVQRSQKALMKRAGVREVTTHGLRHMAATIMLRAGVSLAIVATKLGHGDVATTYLVYGHLVASDQAAANAAIADAIKQGR